MQQPDRFTLRTLRVTGPGSFSMCFRGNPPITHGGGTSVTHQVLNDQEISMVQRTASMCGCSVEAWEMEGQTAEQAEERSALNKEEKVWPCVKCPTCPWAEHLNVTSPCGLEIWPAESVRTLLDTSPVHLEAQGACPIPRHHPVLFPFS